MLKLLVLHLFLIPALTQEIKLESLGNGPGILPFKLGLAKIISHYHSFIQHIDLHEIRSTIESVKTQLDSFSPQLHNRTNSLYQPHMNYLENKLYNVLNQLKSFETDRVKRGLINGLGSVIKSITGNLDYTDAQHYDEAIKSLQASENKLVTEFNSHVSLSKEWSSQYSKIISNIIENQSHLQTLINEISESIITSDNDLIKYAHLAQILLIITDNVDSVTQELYKLQNVLGFIKLSTVHHAVLNLETMNSMISNVSNLYGRQKVLDLDIRDYFDIIKIGSCYVGNKIVIVYKIPIVLPYTYDMYKLSIIPNLNQEILIPPFPYLTLYEKDFMYIEAECPKSSKWYLCEDNRHLQSQESNDCIQHLILTQQRGSSCNPITVSLKKAAFEKLDDLHYSISFPAPTKTHLSCGQDSYRTLHGSYLVTIPQACYIETPQFTLTNVNNRLKGQAVRIMDLPSYNVTPASASKIKLNSIDLKRLHEINTKVGLQPLV
ncbi:uncharacterized protein LOC133319454 [Danaus plexippus]|uniref:uncharacterized protein LOC133319454 n=1 Tax=Danaus plexippus TaxID=13037 RepID=UPI002AB23957|nr:uncharacterized protein LOC133319454 [Danaus plexippus]